MDEDPHAPSSHLFTPLDIGGIRARNRVAVSPMCTYAAGTDGAATDFHLVHLGRLALGGAGIVIAEATAVEMRGRISASDLGLWSDDQVEPLARVARFLSAYGAVPGIQLAHAGRKASTQAPWDGNGPLTDADVDRGVPPWEVAGPTALAAGSGWPTPHGLSGGEVERLVEAWRDAARRAVRAGFRVIDIHGAHGYLLHSFLSPLANLRTDHYGGSVDNRMRFPLEVVRAVRSVLPKDTALFYRLSAIDGPPNGLGVDDTIVFAHALRANGVDLIDVSTGGIVTDRVLDTRVGRGYGFHAPFSRRIREATRAPVGIVGLIVDPLQAEAALRHGDADLVFVGREMLNSPNWALHAQAALGGDAFSDWHREAGWWLRRRDGLLRKLQAAGETPLDRYRPRQPPA